MSLGNDYLQNEVDSVGRQSQDVLEVVESWDDHQKFFQVGQVGPLDQVAHVNVVQRGGSHSNDLDKVELLLSIVICYVALSKFVMRLRNPIGPFLFAHRNKGVLLCTVVL